MNEKRHGGFLVAKVHQAAGRCFSRMLRARGMEINPAQGRVLFVLWQEGPMPLGELAKKVSLNKSTLTNAIDRLEEAGEVTRVRSGDDRRRIDVCLTDRNRKTRKLYEDVSAEMSAQFYRSIGDDDIVRFERTLERILGNLE
jgi:MarR family transcriptional regulator, organic hydroperoxide resistance regulator